MLGSHGYERFLRPVEEATIWRKGRHGDWPGATDRTHTESARATDAGHRLTHQPTDGRRSTGQRQPNSTLPNPDLTYDIHRSCALLPSSRAMHHQYTPRQTMTYSSTSLLARVLLSTTRVTPNETNITTNDLLDATATHYI